MNPVHSPQLKRVFALLDEFEQQIFDPDAARDDALDHASNLMLEASTIEIDGSDDMLRIAELCERAAAECVWIASKFRADARREMTSESAPSESN